MKITEDPPKKKKSRPRLTVRSAAEMLDATPQEMARLLKAQKDPATGDGKFRTPYYQPAITGMVRYFVDGQPALNLARAKFQGFKVPSRRANNERVIDSFQKSPMPARKLSVRPNRRFYAQIGDVQLRLSSDLQANEKGELRVIYFNCRVGAYRPETAQRLLEIACYVLKLNGVEVRPDQLEFHDLFTGIVHRVTSIRQSTLDMLETEVAQVVQLWSEI
jgi:hypothetical protein